MGLAQGHGTEQWQRTACVLQLLAGLSLSLSPAAPHPPSADKLEKCAGISLLIQNTSWLLLLLLSLPLLQAVDFVSL